MFDNINNDPTIQIRIEVSNNYTSCIYCGIINPNSIAECGQCGHKFCNGCSGFLSESHILYHMRRSNHNSIKYAKKKLNENLYFDHDSIEIIACGYCNVSSIFDLYFYKDKEKKKFEFLCSFHYYKKIEEAKEEEKKLFKEKFKKIIYIENNIQYIDEELIQIPSKLDEINLLEDCDIEIVKKNEEIIQLIDPLTQRFLNKVKDKYESSEEYYEIYKPLIMSEFKYVKSIYLSKQEYPTELFLSEENKNKYLYFNIENDFNDINFNIGKRLEFSEEPKTIDELLNISNDAEENERGIPINFTAVIFNIIPDKIDNFKKIMILPITKNINDLTNHLGLYIMRENFCDVPYSRMLNGLDAFNNKKGNNISNLIHSQILGIMEKEQIEKMDESEMKYLYNNNELISKIEGFGELNTHQKTCMNKVFTHSLNMIQGPPGTGKSFLASFIIYNIFQKRKDEQDKILVCAPSNSAADNLAVYLLNLNNYLKENNDNKNGGKNEKEAEELDSDKSTNDKDIINNSKNRKMKLLRVYPKVREIMETNKQLTEISLHNKLNFAIEEYKKMKSKINNLNEEEEEKEEDENEENELKDKTNTLIYNKEKIKDNKKTKNKRKIPKNINIPPKKLKNIADNVVNEHDVIISTCSSSFDYRILNSDFKYVLIDESTQCCEVECLLPLVHGSMHVILIGDQKQLGPTIIYPKANLVGMKISLFERMIKIYPDNYLMLKKQYRMNPEVAKFPSDFFYGGKIKNSSKHKESKYAKKILKKFPWPKKDIPIIFINTNNSSTLFYNLTDMSITKDSKNLNINYFTSERITGKSYENQLEADITVKILKMLNTIKSYKKGKYDIGIITPYIGQKKLILEKLNKDKDEDDDFDYYNNNIINIASVDSFQGKEKDFIIISTVRSNYKNNIGFLKDPRRLNVSLTRAKHGLIIIGDANCLANSPGEKDNKYSVWRYLIKFYQDMGIIVNFNDGKKEKEMFSLTKIIPDGKELDKYKFQEYDYDGKGNKPNINLDYIDDFSYIRNNSNHYINDRDFNFFDEEDIYDENNYPLEEDFYDEDFYYNDFYNDNYYYDNYYNNENMNYNYNNYGYNNNYDHNNYENNYNDYINPNYLNHNYH